MTGADSRALDGGRRPAADDDSRTRAGRMLASGAGDRDDAHHAYDGLAAGSVPTAVVPNVRERSDAARLRRGERVVPLLYGARLGSDQEHVQGRGPGSYDKQVPLPPWGPRAERRPLGLADACELRHTGPCRRPRGRPHSTACSQWHTGSGRRGRSELRCAGRFGGAEPSHWTRSAFALARRAVSKRTQYAPDPLPGKGFGAFHALRSSPVDSSANAKNRHQAGAAAVLIE
jgi:hypothetical protein